MSWQTIKSIVPAALKQAGLSEEVTAVRVLTVAARVLVSQWGEPQAKMMAFVSWSAGKLKAETSSPAAMQTLAKQKVAFMNEVNRVLGDRAVRDLDIRSKGF